MTARMRRLPAMAFSAIAVVLPVSGFAQTNNRIETVLARSSITVARPYIAGLRSSPEIEPLPINLRITEIFRPVVEMMRQRSPTFRRQCARIAAATHLGVTIEADPPRGTSLPSAITHVQRFKLGRIHATVRVTASARAPELIAHELEHVLEQLDGVDLRAKARVPASGVHACDCGANMTAFETVRAVATGLRVASELVR